MAKAIMFREANNAITYLETRLCEVGKQRDALLAFTEGAVEWFAQFPFGESVQARQFGRSCAARLYEEGRAAIKLCDEKGGK